MIPSLHNLSPTRVLVTSQPFHQQYVPAPLRGKVLCRDVSGVSLLNLSRPAIAYRKQCSPAWTHVTNPGENVIPICPDSIASTCFLSTPCIDCPGCPQAILPCRSFVPFRPFHRRYVLTPLRWKVLHRDVLGVETIEFVAPTADRPPEVELQHG